ncbi:MAG: methyltransferase domain-containing protein [Deltaproteobacteria bacterium]|nr:methyltransferase domain-containing protein [Deltaproteobacteria bacterium]
MTQAAHLRYQHKPFVGSSHTWAMARCAELPNSTRVLDIGCGSAAIGRALQARGMQDLFAIEIDAQARANAAGVYKSIGTSLDEFQGQQFDLILILDVLEHLTDPYAFLGRACELLAPQGRLLISVPNIAHWSTRFLLLAGRFDYTERGILDRTHFQFFTRRRVREMIASQPSLNLLRLDASISPAEFALPRWVWDNPLFRACSRLRSALAQWFPGIGAFQHLVEARKS